MVYLLHHGLPKLNILPDNVIYVTIIYDKTPIEQYPYTTSSSNITTHNNNIYCEYLIYERFRSYTYNAFIIGVKVT